MPSVTNKAYDTLLRSVDQMVEGARKHHSNPKIATNLNEKDLLALKAELTALRDRYLRYESEARTAYEQFQAKFKSAQKKVSNDYRIIKGILDPKAEQLLDFGIIPEKSRARNRQLNL